MSRRMRDDIAARDGQSAEVLATIRGIMGVRADGSIAPLSEVCAIKPPKAEARAVLGSGDAVSSAICA